MMAFVAVAAVGLTFASCEKEETSDTGNTPAPTPQPQPTPEGFVDLGLPSGLLWATCNIGASSPEEHGNYYAWGETSTKEIYIWDTYTYAYGNSYDALTKYCNTAMYGHNGFTDNLTTLEAMDDAATAAFGDGVRTPTKEEWEELMANTTAEWTTMNGVDGRIFTATNGNSLFLPAAGYRSSRDRRDLDSHGSYWSSSLDESYTIDAWYVNFYSDGQSVGSQYRYLGRTVRPVRSR